MATGIAGVKDGGKVGTKVDVEVGEAVDVPDGLGVKVGRGDGESVALETLVGLADGESEGIELGVKGVGTISGWSERFRRKIDTINIKMITPNPPMTNRNIGGRSGWESAGGISGDVDAIKMIAGIWEKQN